MYVVTNASGEVELEIDSNSPTAIQHAINVAFPKHTPIFAVSDPTVDAMEKDVEESRHLNPAEGAPAYAMKISGLPWDESRGVGFTLAEVEAQYPLTKAGLKAAHTALREYFPNTPDEFGFSQWETPAKMARKLLKSNTKTSKAIEGFGGKKIPPSYAVGINVMPFALGAMMSAKSAASQKAAYHKDPRNKERPVRFRSLPLVAPRLDDPTKTRAMDWTPKRPQGLCAGSSALCRKTCLVFTGQNGAVAFNDISKMFTERALFFAPLAFARMLIEAIEVHYAYCKKANLKPFVRLNVYSDIPWELLFPDLFDYFEKKYGHDVEKGGLAFYDYTKVPGRGPNPKPNYDLTFSYSGGNIVAMREALRSGMRAAVVFLRATASGSKLPLFDIRPASGRGAAESISAKTEKLAVAMYREKHPGNTKLTVTRKRGATYKDAERLDDLVFEGVPVIDGDPYDMRPLDPKSVIVGLRFKVPKRVDKKAEKSGKSRREAAVETAGAFVLKPPKHDEKFVVHVERLNKDWFFTQVTPGQTGVSLAEQLNDEPRLTSDAE